MKLVVGLGNITTRYDGTRHNVGFAVVDRWLASLEKTKESVPPPQDKFSSTFWDLKLGGERVLVQKPSTYMNLSGVAVRECATFYKVACEDWIIIHDELDLDPAALRVKKGGGTAGHRGLESILAETGEADFWRIRVGIGKQKPVEKYVLERIPADLRPGFDVTYGRASEAISLWIQGKTTQVMNQFNVREKGNTPGSNDGF